MCISCGCQRPRDDHSDLRNITLDDLEAAASAAGISVDEAARNVADGPASAAATHMAMSSKKGRGHEVR